MEPVTFLMFDAHGRGGLARAVIGVANALVEHRPVRVISLLRRAEALHFALDPRIEFEVLVDRHAGLTSWQRLRAGQPTRLTPTPVEGTKGMNRLTDHALRKRLRRFGPGLLVTTRPSLHLAAVTWADSATRVVGWDHKNFVTRYRNRAMRKVLRAAIPELTAYVVLTAADASDYRADLGAEAPLIRVLPNPLSWPAAAIPAPLTNKVVTAAGRLERIKGFDRLIEAYAPLAAEFPDWQLQIHGAGSRADALAEQITRLGLLDRVRLAGYTDDFRGVLRDSAAFVMTSRAEGFPMVLLEALAEGVPVVSMNCPRGPAEIIDHGHNGLLTPDGDVPAFTAALRRVITDEPLRVQLGAQAHADADRYAIAEVAGRWNQLLDTLMPPRRASA